MSTLEVLQDVSGDAAIVRLSGELDISTAAELERVLGDLSVPDGPARI